MRRSSKALKKRPDTHPDILTSSEAPWRFGWKQGLLGIALVACIFCVYLPAWHGGLIWDDLEHVTRPDLRTWNGLYRIWCKVGTTQQYYPVLHSAFWFEYKLWGDAVLGYHLANILHHAIAATLVALILRRLSVPGAFFAAAIFALHPIHVETVAWITQQKNTLSAVFYLSSALVYIYFDQNRKNTLYVAALALFILALLSKPVTVTLPAALLLVFWWQRGRLSWRRDALPLMPFFILAMLSGLLTSWVERHLMGAKGAAFNMTLIECCLLASRAIWFYLGNILWPSELLFVYPRWQIHPMEWRQYFYLIATLALLAAAWRLRLRWRGPLACLLFFVGTLFPMLGFFNIYLFIYTYVADHFTYLASLGIIVLISAGITAMLQRLGYWYRLTGYGACLFLLAGLGCLTWRQSQMYSDIETLYRTTADKNPNSWMILNNLGAISMRHGQLDQAISYLHKSLNAKPDYAEAHYNLGLAYANQSKFNAAIVEYRTALEISPENPVYRNNLGTALIACGRMDEAIVEFQKVLGKHPDFTLVHCNISVVLANLDRYEEAIYHCRKVLEIEPDNAEAPNNLGEALAGRGQLGAAIAQFQEALKIKPDYTQARENLIRVSLMQGRLQKTLADLREKIRLHPKDTALLNDTAWLLATHPDTTIRNGHEAVELAQRAVELSDEKEPAILDTLAAAYAESGLFHQAIQTADKAIKLAEQTKNQSLMDSIKARRQLYKANKPFHTKPKFIAPN